MPGPDFIAVNYVGPTLMLYGTDDQKQRFIPPILRGDEIWCQGYSEPGAGSDLASVQTRAVLEGDTFVLNGQKSGRRMRTGRTGCSCWPAPILKRRSTGESATCS